MNSSIDWLSIPASSTSSHYVAVAVKRQSILTKPVGSLGSLEKTAITLAGMQGAENPDVSRIHCSVFAADHGIAAEGVSVFPQVVTGEMIRNFSSGGAAICVIARSIGANLEVINLGVVTDLGPLAGVIDSIMGSGTRNFTKEPAMNEQQLSGALYVGRQAVERARLEKCQLFIGGEMGIANTSSATAIISVLLKLKPEDIAGPGTGLDSDGVNHKARVISQAIKLHCHEMHSPLDVLRCVGGFEIAALAGAYITCAQFGIPILVDGFISSSAALLAIRILPDVENWMLYSHTSAEPGHRVVLQALNAEPLLDLNMRLGEGSGAATTVPLIQLACKLHNEMASFAEASVSNKK